MRTTTQWRARPVATIAVKAAILLVPMMAGTVAGLVVAGLLPVPAGLALRVGWVLVVLAACTVTLLLFERLARRAAPLALLLKLGLVFPEQVPHRFGVALKAIRPRRHEDGERLEAAESLALLASLLTHDRRTRGHSERVAAYAAMIAEELGIDGQDRDRLTWGALLHDIGKLQVPADILTKPSALDDEEWSIMAGHPAFGSALVDPLRPWLGDALSAVDGHHERFDGTGYPYRRPSGSLPVAARVAAVADAFETMTAARSYKDPMPLAAARAEVAACAGGQFDPAVCRAFLALSLPRLWRVAGPLSWLAQIPLIGVVVRGEMPVVVSSAAQGAALATGQAVTAAAVVGGALLVGARPITAWKPDGHPLRPRPRSPARLILATRGRTMDRTAAAEVERTAPGPVLPAPGATIPRFLTRPSRSARSRARIRHDHPAAAMWWGVWSIRWWTQWTTWSVGPVVAAMWWGVWSIRWWMPWTMWSAGCWTAAGTAAAGVGTAAVGAAGVGTAAAAAASWVACWVAATAARTERGFPTVGT